MTVIEVSENLSVLMHWKSYGKDENLDSGPVKSGEALGGGGVSKSWSFFLCTTTSYLHWVRKRLLVCDGKLTRTSVLAA